MYLPIERSVFLCQVSFSVYNKHDFGPCPSVHYILYKVSAPQQDFWDVVDLKEMKVFVKIDGDSLKIVYSPCLRILSFTIFKCQAY